MPVSCRVARVAPSSCFGAQVINPPCEANLDRSLLNSAISACREKWQQAVALLSQARGLQLLPDTVSHNLLLSSLGAEEWPTALKTLRSLKTARIVGGIISYNALSSGLGKAGRWRKVLETLTFIGSNHLEATDITHTAVLSSLGHPQTSVSTRRWRLALLLQGRLEERNGIICNAAIGACEAAGRWSEALALLEETRKLGRVSSISFNATISSCQKASVWQLAILLLHKMEEERCLANVISCNSAISACGDASEWQAASCLLEMMMGQPGQFEPNVVSCNAMLSACANANVWQQTLAWLGWAVSRSLEVDVITCNAVVSACEDAGRWQQSLMLLDVFANRQVKCNIISCNAVISACEKASAWQQALFLLHATKLQRLQPSVVTYNAAIKSAEGGTACSCWQQQLLLLMEMEMHGLRPNVATCASVLNAFSRHQMIHSILQILDRMDGMAMATWMATGGYSE